MGLRPNYSAIFSASTKDEAPSQTISRPYIFVFSRDILIAPQLWGNCTIVVGQLHHSCGAMGITEIKTKAVLAKTIGKEARTSLSAMTEFVVLIENVIGSKYTEVSKEFVLIANVIGSKYTEVSNVPHVACNA